MRIYYTGFIILGPLLGDFMEGLKSRALLCIICCQQKEVILSLGVLTILI